MSTYRKIDAFVFAQHLNVLVQGLKNKRDVWQDADAVCIPVGKFEAGWFKSTAIHSYLFGLEFADTILCLTETTLHVVTSQKKTTRYFRPLADRVAAEGFRPTPEVRVRLTALTKNDNAANAAAFEGVIEDMRASRNGKKVAMLTRELKYLSEGTVFPAWSTAFDAAGFEVVNAVGGVASVFAKKDKTAIAHLKSAGSIVARLYRNGLVEKMEEVIADDVETTHEKFAIGVEKLLDNPKEFRGKYDPNDGDVESCFAPLVQSGGAYSFKHGAMSDEKRVSFDVIATTVACRYKLYCASMTRTLFVDASKKQRKAYGCLVDAYDACLKAIRPRAKFSDVHAAAMRSLRESAMPELADCLYKSVGAGIGIELKESLNLTANSANVIRDGMVFNVYVALENVSHEVGPEDAKAGGAGAMKTYSMKVGDTVLVLKEEDDKTGRFNRALTKSKHEWHNVAWTKNREEEEEDEDEDDDNDNDNEAKAGDDDGATIGARTRGATRRSERVDQRDREVEETNVQAELRRQEQQRKLIERRMEKHANDGRVVDNETKQTVVDTAALDRKAYPSTAQFPKEVRNYAVHVDEEKEVVFIPINGASVPFHISTIKNVSKDDAHRVVILRINFETPAKTTASQMRNRHTLPNLAASKFPRAAFLKSISVRSAHSDNLNRQLRLIKELQKRIRLRMRAKEELKDVVKQAKLKLIRNPPKLVDLDARPQLSGRRSHGTLEAHENGFRFRSDKGEKLDINYDVVKHAIFQPCKNETMVLLHFHLKHPIIVNRKKTTDVQFFTEVVERSVALKKSRRSMYDPDEIDEEQRERKLRQKLNSLFQKFYKRVNRLLETQLGREPLDVDIPFYDLMFQGTPKRDMVKLFPCTNCLVNLTESPSFVLSLDDIDHVHFERATVSTRTANFDMAIILKDRKKSVVVIRSIETRKLALIEDWITSIGVTYTKGSTPVVWPKMMKSVVDAEQDGIFWLDHWPEDGTPKSVGWLMLSEEANLDGGEGEDGEGEDDDASEFEPDSEEEEEDDYDPSESEEESEEEFEEESDEGDWEEMERDAAAADARAARKRKAEHEADRRRRKRR